MHQPPPEGFRSALDAAFRDAGRPAPVLVGLEAIPGGSINQTFLLRTASGVYFCKWNPTAPPGMFRREAEGLAALAGSGTSLRIPRSIALSPDAPVARQSLDAPIPAQEPQTPLRPSLLVLEYLESDADGPSKRTWELLGRGLAELHHAGEERFGFDRDNYCGLTLQENAWSDSWPEFYAQRRIGALVDRLGKRGDLGAAEIRDYAKLMERFPELLAHKPAPSLIHGDLWSGNFMAAVNGPTLVDPAAYCADREAEWGMMLLFGGFPETVLAAYQEAWPLPEGWRERVPLYQLYHVLNHFLLFGGAYGGRALAIARTFL
ncbi:MAG: ketosamine-3-kinase [Fibrobacteres bacterium]|nr:ketosamine-3-kinase [Fibrobacterota bacterium]